MIGMGITMGTSIDTALISMVFFMDMTDIINIRIVSEEEDCLIINTICLPMHPDMASVRLDR